MSTVKIRSLTTTATTTASDDFLVIDGTTNSTRKLSAATPAFLTSVTVPTVATAAGVNLNLATGTAASDKVLIPGTLEATAADGLAASIGTLGGASVKKALWVGGIINVAGHTTFEGVTSTGATGTGKLVYDTSPSLTTPALGTPSTLIGTNISGTAASLTAGNVTTNANLTGDVTSVGNATSIAAGVIVNADINASAAIVDTKLDTIATALKVSNSATTAASANTASAIVARDASGNFSAGTVSAALTGNASTATALATGRTIAITGDLAYTSPSFDGSGNVTAAGTLASVASAGTSGGSTAIPVVTINAKGLTTSITTAAVIAPAGTLTGSTLASGVTASSLTSLGTIGSLVVTAGTISGTPSASTDIANKLYVDTVAQGLDAKASCIAATTADITLSGTQTIDGISVIAADRVLVKNQTLSQNNGIYLCASGAWTRTTDADTWDELISAFTFIETGTVNADTGYVCTANAGGTLGTTALPWSQFSGAGSYTASTGLTLTGTVFSLTAPVTVALGGTNATSAGIAAFNNISGFTAAGATGTTSTNLVFSTSPSLTSPTITSGILNGTLGATTPSTIAATTATASGNVAIGAAGQALRTINLDVTASGANDSAAISIASKGTGISTLSMVTQGRAAGWDINYNFPATGDLSFTTLATSATVAKLTSTGLNSCAIGATTPSTIAATTISASGTTTVGPNNAGTGVGLLQLLGGSGTNGGASVNFGTNGTAYSSIGQISGIIGGTSTDFVIYANNGSQNIKFYAGGGGNIATITSTGLQGAIGATTPSTGAFTTGIINLSSGSDQQETLSVRGNSGVGMLFRPSFSAGTQPNWRVAASIAAGSTLEITPSTTNGGTTFTTPVATFTSAGLAVTGGISATSTATFTGGNLFFTATASSSNIPAQFGNALGNLSIGGSDGGAVFIDSNSWNLGLRTGGTTRGYFSSTGLAVTGVINVTGTAGGNMVNYLTSAAGYGSYLEMGPSGSWAELNADLSGNFNITTNGVAANVFVLKRASSVSNTLVLDSGNVFIGTASTLNGKISVSFAGNVVNGIQLSDSTNTSGATFANFTNASNTTCGSIQRVTTTNAIQVNYSSDRRLKHNIRDFTDSGSLIDGLRPVRFDWNGDKENDDLKDAIGFIAQETHASSPVFARIGAISVGDDDQDTITKQWGRSDTALIPILVAELQSLRKRLAALEAK